MTAHEVPTHVPWVSREVPSSLPRADVAQQQQQQQQQQTVASASASGVRACSAAGPTAVAMRRSRSRRSDIVPAKSLTQTLRSLAASTRRASTRTPSPSLSTRASRIISAFSACAISRSGRRVPANCCALVCDTTPIVRMRASSLVTPSVRRAARSVSAASFEYSANGSTAMVTIGVARPTDVQRPVRQTVKPSGSASTTAMMSAASPGRHLDRGAARSIAGGAAGSGGCAGRRSKVAA